MIFESIMVVTRVVGYNFNCTVSMMYGRFYAESSVELSLLVICFRCFYVTWFFQIFNGWKTAGGQRER